ncbi:unnamed protein product, partial [Ectocarpus sp. 13 AM-2016]
STEDRKTILKQTTVYRKGETAHGLCENQLTQIAASQEGNRHHSTIILLWPLRPPFFSGVPYSGNFRPPQWIGSSPLLFGERALCRRTRCLVIQRTGRQVHRHKHIHPQSSPKHTFLVELCALL